MTGARLDAREGPDVDGKDAETVRAHVRKVAQTEGVIRCAVCAQAVAGPTRACSSCESAYHPDCWTYNDGCAVFGCRAAPARPPPIDLDVTLRIDGRAARPGAIHGTLTGSTCAALIALVAAGASWCAGAGPFRTAGPPASSGEPAGGSDPSGAGPVESAGLYGTAPASAAAAAPSGGPDVSEYVSLDFRDVPLSQVINALVYKQSVNILVPPDLTQRVTVKLDGVPWKSALEVILSHHGLGFEEIDGIIRIDVAERLNRKPITRSYEVRFLDSDTIGQLLGSQLTRPENARLIEVPGRAGTTLRRVYVVTDVPSVQKRIDDALREFDAPGTTVRSTPAAAGGPGPRR
jgi:hypothetical protein